MAAVCCMPSKHTQGTRNAETQMESFCLQRHSGVSPGPLNTRTVFADGHLRPTVGSEHWRFFAFVYPRHALTVEFGN
ncbi:hypothetical protein BaRGS_00010513 [Batillaria attramentaria]|uniref:Uncharacterized protein n=1 Tax=Batillaria attramentaria TaxID=370345 RepID=A0ABD0LG94_9CAEN